MIDTNSKVCINCHTVEEQNMILDIFEMLGMIWREEQEPRGYRSAKCPMSYALDGNGRFGQHRYILSENNIQASECRNQWISLKIKKEKQNE